MKNFESFVNNQNNKGKLYIETDDGQYDERWKMTIDISKLWESYVNNTITIIDFNNQYASFLMEQQQNISSTVGDSCWNDIEPIVVDELRKSTNIEDSEVVYNKLYDIYDQYEININCGNIEQMKK